MLGNDELLTTREYDLLEACHYRKQTLEGDVRRHLYHGFVQRLMMLQAGRKNLLRDADPLDTAPRGVHMAAEMSLQANAYYLNLRGALDNLAWCLQYQWVLIPGTDEMKGKRLSIYLFGQEFLKALDQHDSDLARFLRSKEEWAADLSSRRDPAAHRIPLQVPYRVFSERDAGQFRAIEAQAASVFASGNYDEGMALELSPDQLGTFVPMLVQAAATGPVTEELHSRVSVDHEELLGVAAAVIKCLGTDT